MPGNSGSWGWPADCRLLTRFCLPPDICHLLPRPLLLAPSPLQEAIRELQLCTTVDNEELQKMGVRLELDERSGKLKVSKRDE